MDGGERDAGKGDASLTGRETHVFFGLPKFWEKNSEGKKRKRKGKRKERKKE